MCVRARVRVYVCACACACACAFVCVCVCACVCARTRVCWGRPPPAVCRYDEGDGAKFLPAVNMTTQQWCVSAGIPRQEDFSGEAFTWPGNATSGPSLQQ